MRDALLAYLTEKSRQVDQCVQNHAKEITALPCLDQGAYAYVKRGGKRLRPAVLSLCAGLLGGDKNEKAALPAAAGIELFHTWTLIHDDIIDHDDLRRGGPSVHAQARQNIKSKMPHLSLDTAAEYGIDVAILAGDLLHARAISLFTKLPKYGVSPLVTTILIDLLETRYLGRLLDGEMEDTALGLLFDCSEASLSAVKEETVLQVMAGKTSALFAYCAMAGGMIGLDSAETEHPQILALADFAGNCGLAFQLQDDILGIVGNVKTLGKPIGSDIREGKKSILLVHAYQNATREERRFLSSVCGNRNAADTDVEKAANILIARKGIQYTSALAKACLEKALHSADILPDNLYKDLLMSWADMMISRNF